jgi:hypothetical protein
VVCAVWLGAGWWAAPLVEVQLSALTSLSKGLGFVRAGDPPHPLVGYDTDATRPQDRVSAQAVPGPR